MITDADIASLKSLHTSFNKYLNHMLLKLEHNRLVRNIQFLEFFGKNDKHIRESIDAILEELSAT